MTGRGGSFGIPNPRPPSATHQVERVDLAARARSVLAIKSTRRSTGQSSGTYGPGVGTRTTIRCVGPGTPLVSSTWTAQDRVLADA